MPPARQLFGTVKRVPRRDPAMARVPADLREVGELLAFLRQPGPLKDEGGAGPSAPGPHRHGHATEDEHAPVHEVVLDRRHRPSPLIQTCWPGEPGLDHCSAWWSRVLPEARTTTTRYLPAAGARQRRNRYVLVAPRRAQHHRRWKALAGRTPRPPGGDRRRSRNEPGQGGRAVLDTLSEPALPGLRLPPSWSTPGDQTCSRTPRRRSSSRSVPGRPCRRRSYGDHTLLSTTPCREALSGVRGDRDAMRREPIYLTTTRGARRTSPACRERR